jgi:triosephosphate isomerase
MYKTVGEAALFTNELVKNIDVVENREVVVCPPATALYTLKAIVKDTPVALGGQNMHAAVEGAFTGEVSPTMLLDAGCRYVIIGHSERRQFFCETDESVNRKVHAALLHGLRPIMCVGESKPQRDNGNAEEVVVAQVRAGLLKVTAQQINDMVIAYEPIWAIGTGDTATPADAQAMHAAIRACVAELYDDATAQGLRIQYGGSVKANNVDELMAQPDIDGALVGGASLTVDSFLRIVHFQ